MPVARASNSAVVGAPAHAVYALLADYREGHRRILPERYFPWLEVERGGTGAGTIIRFQIRAPGVSRVIRAEITEPVPGRSLAETDLATGARTTFTVTEEASGRTCRVMIETEWEAKGLRGWVQRLTAPPLLRKIFAVELAMLAALASAELSTDASGPA